MLTREVTYDDILAELTRRRLSLNAIAEAQQTSRQYARWVVIQRCAGILPGAHTKGYRMLVAIDAALGLSLLASEPASNT
jgi:hypothetical protein